MICSHVRRAIAVAAICSLITRSDARENSWITLTPFYLTPATLAFSPTDSAVVDQVQDSVNYGFMFDRDNERWQQFRPTRTSIVRVDLYIDRRGNPGDAIITIKNSQQQTLYSATVPQAQIPVGTNWVPITIFPAVSVTPESTYALFIKTPGLRVNFDSSYYWSGKISSSYTRGITSVEPQWPGYDFAFRTYAPYVPPSPPQYSASGMSGHLGTNLNNGEPKAGFQHGLSFYSSVYLLDLLTTRSTQLGWGTWWMPENLTFTQPLCPVGTFARDHWPERGPTYRDVYQTLEGGIGQWATTRFPSSSPKYRINGVPDCYNTQIASPGWSFGGDTLRSNKHGLAQLSNRLLLAPDGITFSNVENVSLLGNAWIALPFIPSNISPSGVLTGDQSWTLFLHAANFKGPVAFFTPEIWSAINAMDPTGVGRGHDARPGFTAGIAIEIGNAPTFTATDANGVRYKRIPRLTFPTDENGKAVLLQDVVFYSKQAMWDAVNNWVQNGTVVTQMNPAGLFSPTVSGSGVGVYFAGVPATYDASFYAGAVQASANSGAFGMQWSGQMERGVFPEYYKEEGQTWRAVPASQVPASTGLTNQSFPRSNRIPFPDLNTSSTSTWTSAKWAAGPFTASLNDSSIVEYVWYKFIEQPAIARLGLSASVLERLQTFVESLHQNSGVNGITISPPSSGSLVTIDNAQIVTPPPGLEKGYVPIVIRQ